MQAHELKKYLRSLSSDLLDTAAHIVAETATAYYKESFRRKAFDGKQWKPAKRAKRKGSLLVASSAMMHSIRPSEVSPQRVVISAGGDKVTYAQAHNEGFVGNVNIPAHDRRVKPPKSKGKGKGKAGKSVTIQHVRPHQRMMRLPRRRFMGNSRELNAEIVKRIKGYIAHNKK